VQNGHEVDAAAGEEFDLTPEEPLELRDPRTLDAGEAASPLAEGGAASADEAMEAAGGVAESFEDEGLTGEGGDLGGEGVPLPPAEAENATTKRLGKPGPLVWIAPAALLLAAGGYFGWTLFSSSEEPPAVDPRVQAEAEVRRSLRSGIPEEFPGQSEPVGQPEDAPTPPPAVTEQLAAALARAEEALASADYGAAIIAFNEALKLAPDNADLRRRLQDAADRYRVQQEHQERWNEAFTAFESGNYREALAFFYRVPDGADQAQVDRYKVNGWYNLGVLALQSRDCETARAHLGEARGIQSDDVGVNEAARLALRCGQDRSASFAATIAALELRRLED
jgi:tetratricopeptide (TPR) repeat protein